MRFALRRRSPRPAASTNASTIAEDYPLPRRKVRWLGLVFFIVPARRRNRRHASVHLLSRDHGSRARAVLRLLRSDRVFDHDGLSPAVRAPDLQGVAGRALLLLLFGAATFEESALKWSSQHRQHHRFTDTEHDPYGVNRGFWHAHIGWIMFWRHRTNYDNVKDLRRSRLVSHQHDHHAWWSVGGGHRPSDAHRVVDRASAGRIHHGGLPAHRRRPALLVLRQFVRAHVRHRDRTSRRSRRATTGRRNSHQRRGLPQFSPPVSHGLPQWRPLVSLGSLEVVHLHPVEARPRLGSQEDLRHSIAAAVGH